MAEKEIPLSLTTIPIPCAGTSRSQIDLLNRHPLVCILARTAARLLRKSATGMLFRRFIVCLLQRLPSHLGKVFLDAKDCWTCQKIVRYFLSFVPMSELHPDCLLEIYCDSKFDETKLSIIANFNQKPYGLELFPPQEFKPNGKHCVKTDCNSIDLERIKEWISYCDSMHHNTCHGSNPEPLFQSPPKMILIDVRDLRLRLCAQFERYAALSYVWGGAADSFVSVKSNIDELLKPGSLAKYWDELPATVRDAILLVKALNVPFLWVDRLCIVQDDEDSIDGNIAWMASIYANSYFAIFATEGANAEFGLRGIGSPSGPRVCERLNLFFEDLGFGEAQFEDSDVWHTRAWTFQERAVARRCLVFYKGTVDWECQISKFKENLALVHHDDHGKEDEPRYNISPRLWPDFKQFHQLCVGYSWRKLRYQADALKGFTAIVNVFTASFPGGFLYAMPEFVFDVALAWYHTSSGGRRKMFPSWSWLGWEGAVMLQSWNPHQRHKWKDLRRPMGRWRKRNMSTGELVDINNTYYLWEAFTTDTQTEAPVGWTRVNTGEKMVYRHESVEVKDLNNHNICHPVPIASSMAAVPDLRKWDPLIYGNVHFTTLVLGNYKRKDSTVIDVDVYTDDGQWIGTMNTLVDTTDYSKETECVVIAISRVTKIRNKDDLFYRMGFQQDMEGNNTYELIEVLWIGWENNLAYRKGSGRVWANSWDKQDVKEMEIALG